MSQDREDRNRTYNMILTLLIVLGLILIFLFRTSFAKYKKEVIGKVNADVADWTIKINTEDIRGKRVLTNAITPTFEGDTYTKANVVAPGSTGYFDLDIDATNADVSFNYTITATTASESDVSDIIIERYKINDAGEVAYNSAAGITGTITRNTPSTRIKVFIKWNDTGTQSMDNEADTTAGGNPTAQAIIDVNIHLIQVRSS
ncbi:MAG: hypothetical protein IJI43_03515 [Bacilli bacterium]|nr:hypothetical protein [Bacilli bacterium]